MHTRMVLWFLALVAVVFATWQHPLERSVAVDPAEMNTVEDADIDGMDQPIPAPSARPVKKSQQDKVKPVFESRGQLNALATKNLQERMKHDLTLEDEFYAEPVSAEAPEYESETWSKLVGLPGVESAAVQCRTSTCKVTMTGKINPATGFDIKGLTFYAKGSDGLVFFYDKALDVE